MSLRGACPVSARLGAHGVAGSPKGNYSLTLPFITTEARVSVGPSAHTGTVTLGAWHVTAGPVMPCLLSQYRRILWDGHHICTQKAVSQSSLIYWQYLSHSMWKTAPLNIPPLGKRQLKSQYKQPAHLDRNVPVLFKRFTAESRSHMAWHDKG